MVIIQMIMTNILKSFRHILWSTLRRYITRESHKFLHTARTPRGIDNSSLLVYAIGA